MARAKFYSALDAIKHPQFLELKQAKQMIGAC
jgi:hypothetical protein